MLFEKLKEYAGIKGTACILGYIQCGGTSVGKSRILATKWTLLPWKIKWQKRLS